MNNVIQYSVGQRRDPMPHSKCPVTFLIKMYSEHRYTDQPGHIMILAISTMNRLLNAGFVARYLCYTEVIIEIK